MNAPQTTQRDPRWTALRARDPAYDGRFVYSVRSTGVYCRPSCSARAARPENVAFHADCDAAEAAGFRPCKRCRPRQASPAEARAALMARICRTIDAAPEPPRLAVLARQAGMSPYHFQRVFKATVGLSPRAYALAQRARRVRGGLRRAGSVTQAILDAGYNSGGRFYAHSNEMLGMTPRAYRAGGTGATIRFAVGDCSLGAVLVARSDKGICAILLGDDPARLVRDLEDRFPRANLVGGDAGFERCVAAVVRCVDEPAAGLKLPLDVRGTVFQQKVWQALRRIPPGHTASYAEIARRIGAPRSARAVAQACAANALAVAIPCHRVVRRDGSLSGYRWGIERKRALLAREGGAKPA
ncbi:MAG TPA: bifunctional DNA-binding transcriptional regulator/O6-methylguanine-DNA methyltransferase Ada [Steroidobacteraceae bacterium]|nr:bifunctional DNA-binding transcriptional regulator/O6-methylguanine-DNA methyltransferase Ada [Steroidobacteraceae bacterium]